MKKTNDKIEIRVTIPGNPIAKARPRFARREKFVRTYNPQETEEGLFVARFHNQAGITSPLTGPLIVMCEFHMRRPKNHYGTGKNSERLKPSVSKYHTQTPDTDNLTKFVLDALNGYAWVDDCQIIATNAVKRWADDFPKTEIVIMGV